MHRSESRELANCADCGAEIAPARDRAWAGGGELFLCFACALRRGDSYDEAHDRWVTAPDARDLPPPE